MRKDCVGFNGATAIQPWILANHYHERLTRLSLQWSHGYSAVDMTGVANGDHLAVVVLQWSHGYSAVDILIKHLPNTANH